VAVYDKPLKNFLFSPEERLAMTKHVFESNPKIIVTGYSGITVNFCKKIGAQLMIRGLRVFSDFEYEFRIALANHRLAPDIEVIAFITSEEHTFLSSSTVREIASLKGDVSSFVPPHVNTALINRFAALGEDHMVSPLIPVKD
jgi:pantetheine-phosphate adenylyltransferase